MTKDEIIRMAREAGLADANGVVHAAYQLETFANLAAAAEREECAKVCEGRLQEGLNFEGCATAIRARGTT